MGKFNQMENDQMEFNQMKKNQMEKVGIIALTLTPNLRITSKDWKPE